MNRRSLTHFTLPALLLALGAPAYPQTAPGGTPIAAASQGASYHAIRASVVIGKSVHGTDGKDLGKISDLIVDTTTGDVRYAILEFDPGFFKSDKLFAVPVKELAFAGDDKPLLYRKMNRPQLEKTGVDKADWQKALDNRRYVDGLDQNYGFKPPAGNAHSFRASKLIGKDVNNRAGKDIGQINDLVLDMGASKVAYAVLGFDPSWFAREKMFAFPLSAFQHVSGKDDLILDVDKAKLEAMKSFDAGRWGHLNDLDHDTFVNGGTMAKS